MADTKNLCAQIPLTLHDRVCTEKDQAGLTTAQYITNLLTILPDERKRREHEYG